MIAAIASTAALNLAFASCIMLHPDEDEQDDAETQEADRIMIKIFSESTNK